MKQLLRFALIALSCSFVIPCCEKSNGDDDYFIEATINGQQWKGTSNGKFIAINTDDNSRIQIKAGSLPVGSYTFFTNSSSGGVDVDLPGVTHLTGFGYGAFDSKLTLKWASLFETNVARYEIERALETDIYTFHLLGQVNAQGTSTSRVDYSFPVTAAENFPSEVAQYYRIKIIKTDNSFLYTSVWLTRGLSIPNTPMISYLKNGRLYYCLDNNQNRVTITHADSSPEGSRRGTFSFSFKDENGNLVNVTNGKFHLKY